MVLASPNPLKFEKIRGDVQLPLIDLRSDRSLAAAQIAKACEEFGFFKVINHGVPQEITSRMDREARHFFSKPGPDKQRAGPASPYGYGLKNIGLNGDMGELEYLLLQANAPHISHMSEFISDDPREFSGAAIGYVAAVRELACEILDMVWEFLSGAAHPTTSPSLFSRLIRDVHSDSVLRLNRYLPTSDHPKIGFGEHTDPQILTLLRSNGVGGLQISTDDGIWVPVSPYPESAFCVNVGDVLQIMTNGRFKSVKHRAIVDSFDSRMSVAYFAAPSLDASISCISGFSSPQKPPLYRSFTWAEYKKAAYALRLGESRLNLFKTCT